MRVQRWPFRKITIVRVIWRLVTETLPNLLRLPGANKASCPVKNPLVIVQANLPARFRNEQLPQRPILGIYLRIRGLVSRGDLVGAEQEAIWIKVQEIGGYPRGFGRRQNIFSHI